MTKTEWFLFRVVASTSVVLAFAPNSFLRTLVITIIVMGALDVARFFGHMMGEKK